MTIETIREHCLKLPEATEDMPFDETTLCFRVGNKIFAITDIDKKPCSINLKCDPETAVYLRESFKSIIPGIHCNKKHWNTINFDDSISEDLFKKMLLHSYLLVFNSLKAADKKQIKEKYGNNFFESNGNLNREDF